MPGCAPGGGDCRAGISAWQAGVPRAQQRVLANLACSALTGCLRMDEKQLAAPPLMAPRSLMQNAVLGAPCKRNLSCVLSGVLRTHETHLSDSPVWHKAAYCKATGAVRQAGKRDLDMSPE